MTPRTREHYITATMSTMDGRKVWLACRCGVAFDGPTEEVANSRWMDHTLEAHKLESGA